MSVQDNEKRIERLDRDKQRRDVCETIRTRLEGRIRTVENHVDGLRQRTTGILVAVILAVLGIAANLALALMKS